MALRRLPFSLGLFGVCSLNAAATLPAQTEARILGYVAQSGSVNTTDLIVRRPPLRGGAVTSAGGSYDAVGSWTEQGTFNGSYSYSVSIKATGSWNAGTKQMKETLVVTLANYEKGQDKANGTWTFGSSSPVHRRRCRTSRPSWST